MQVLIYLFNCFAKLREFTSKKTRSRLNHFSLMFPTLFVNTIIFFFELHILTVITREKKNHTMISEKLSLITRTIQLLIVSISTNYKLNSYNRKTVKRNNS